MAFDVQRVIAAYQQGRAIKDQKDKKVRDIEDRDFELKQRAAQLKLDNIQQQLMKRKLEQENLAALEGSVAPEQTMPGGTLPSGLIQVPDTTITAPLEPLKISGIPELAVEGYTKAPRSMQDILRQQREQKVFESSLVKPKVSTFGVEQGLYDEEGNVLREPVKKPDNPANLQRVTGKLNGMAVTAGWSPDNNTYYVAGQDVTKQFIPDKPPVQPVAKPGAYSPVFDARGEIIGKFDSETGDITPLKPEGYRKGALSPERQKMEENAKSGLRVIKDLRAELKKPGVLAALAVPGSPTARKARAARNEMIDVMTRLRTGAALNQSEQAFYRDQAPALIDALFADPDTIEYKLSIFENEFKGLASPSGAAPTADSSGWKIIGVK